MQNKIHPRRTSRHLQRARWRGKRRLPCAGQHLVAERVLPWRTLPEWHATDIDMDLVKIIRAGERIRDKDVCTLRLCRPSAYIRCLADDVATGANIERAADPGTELRRCGRHIPAPAVTGFWLRDDGVQGW